MSDFAAAKPRNPVAAQHAQEMRAAFARADRERFELQRLKALHPQWSGLYFHPERLAARTFNVEPESHDEYEGAEAA